MKALPIAGQQIVQINYINILLMLISIVIAFFVPFELFLASYAILGPLHYLTEISWLQEKNYFVKSKYDVLVFLVIGLVLLYGILQPGRHTLTVTTAVLFVGVVFAVTILFTEHVLVKGLAIVLSIALIQVFNLTTNYIFFLIFAVFLPTLFHVFFCTGAFILQGTLRNRHFSGYLSLGVYVLCCFMPLLLSDLMIPTFTTKYSLKNYQLYTVLNDSLSYIFGHGKFGRSKEMYFSSFGIGLMRFIAFVYTYHYFNWFSKTSVIKWHEVPKVRLWSVGILWIISVGLYAYNYVLGFIALYFLSMLHVLLELPLNNLTFIQIGKMMVGKSSSGTK